MKHRVETYDSVHVMLEPTMYTLTPAARNVPWIRGSRAMVLEMEVVNAYNNHTEYKQASERCKGCRVNDRFPKAPPWARTPATSR
jgi:hypothetical protein